MHLDPHIRCVIGTLLIVIFLADSGKGEEPDSPRCLAYATVASLPLKIEQYAGALLLPQQR